MPDRPPAPRHAPGFRRSIQPAPRRPPEPAPDPSISACPNDRGHRKRQSCGLPRLPPEARLWPTPGCGRHSDIPPPSRRLRQRAPDMTELESTAAYSQHLPSCRAAGPVCAACICVGLRGRPALPAGRQNPVAEWRASRVWPMYSRSVLRTPAAPATAGTPSDPGERDSGPQRRSSVDRTGVPPNSASSKA